MELDGGVCDGDWLGAVSGLVDGLANDGVAGRAGLGAGVAADEGGVALLAGAPVDGLLVGEPLDALLTEGPADGLLTEGPGDGLADGPLMGVAGDGLGPPDWTAGAGAGSAVAAAGWFATIAGPLFAPFAAGMALPAPVFPAFAPALPPFAVAGDAPALEVAGSAVAVALDSELPL